MPLFPSPQALALVATTGAAGVALINGTQTLITWTAPNDGQMHRAAIYGSLFVSGTETGGGLQAAWEGPNASATSLSTLLGSGQAAATTAYPFTSYQLTVAAGTTVQVRQVTALSVGTAVATAEIWAS